MITSQFIVLFFILISGLINQLPTASTTSGIGLAITTASSYISAVYSFLPAITVTILAVLAFDLVFETAYIFYKIIYWIIRRFPTQS